uniref:Mitochondrial inner membrane protein n=1 Tax=Rhodopseudomonas palustris (strain BisA53) TaxID=316055 RepID=Q07VL0_RHOP5
MVEGKPDNNLDQPEAQGAEGVTPPEIRETEFIEESELSGRDVDEAGKPAAPAAEVAAESAAEQLADPVPPAARAASAEAPAPAPAPPPRSSSPLLPLLSGAVGAAIVVGAAWFTVGQNLTAPPPADTAALESLAARVASAEAKASAAASSTAVAAVPDPEVSRRIEALEKSVAALRDDVAAAAEKTAQLAAAMSAAKPAPAGEAGAAAPPPADLAEFSERLMQLEAAAKMPAAASVDLAPVTERLTQVEAALKTLPPVPPPVDLSAVNAHLAKLDAAVEKPPSFDDTGLRRVVAGLLLDTSVRQGEAYGALLEIAKPLAADAAALQPLDGFAATGVPNNTVLSRELIALLPKLIPGYDPLDSTASILDRLQAGADRLVRFQRPGAPGTKERSAILGRMIAAARRNDVAEAKAELNLLEPAERAPAQAWIERVEARDAALAASRQFAAAAMAALPKQSP